MATDIKALQKDLKSGDIDNCFSRSDLCDALDELEAARDTAFYAVQSNKLLIEEREAAIAALKNVCGALCDSGVVVPENESQYGLAVQEIVKERDALAFRLKGAHIELGRWEALDKGINAYGEREAVTLRAELATVTKEREELRGAMREILGGFFGRCYMGGGPIVPCPNGIDEDRYKELCALAYGECKI